MDKSNLLSMRWLGVEPAPEATFAIRRINSAFTFVAVFLLGWLGSGFSVLVVGAFALALLRIAGKWLAISAPHPAGILAWAGFGLFLSAILMNVIHPDGGNLVLIAQRASFLAILPLLAAYRLSPPTQTLVALEYGALAGAFAAVAIAIIQIKWVEPRASGFSGNPGPFALAATLIFFVNFTAALRRSGRAAVPFHLGAVAAAVAVAASGMRSFWIILFAAAVIALFGQKRANRTPLATVALLAAAVAAVAWLAMGDRFVMRFGALYADLLANGLVPDAETSLGRRVTMWQCGLEAVAQSPWFGHGLVGARGFLETCSQSLTGTAFATSHYHNFALHALAVGGVTELAAVAAMVFLPALVTFGVRAEGTGRAGIAMLRMLTAVYALAGATGIMFGNDIQDLAFVFVIVLALHFIGNDGLRSSNAGLQKEDK